MARTLGIRLGAQSFELLMLEGSAKKPRIAQSAMGEIAWDGDDPAAAASAAIKEAGKRFKKKPDAVHVAIDAGQAAFRSLTVPFEEKEKIESVLKFEVESQLPQWDIDQVVCDFHVLNSTGVESHLLVTAVQKDDIWSAITSAEKGGFEPQEVELEAVSVLNAAHAKGVFHADEAHLLVYVGESSTSISVVDGGQLRGMRAMHVGALATPQAPAEDTAAEGADEPGMLGEDEDEASEASTQPAPNDSSARLGQVAARVRRELTRAVTAAQVANPIQAVYIVGARLPGLEGSVIDEIPVSRLDVFPEDSDLTEGERLRLAAAYGVALGAMGGGLMSSQLRREELRFTGRFERIELPLAVCCLMLFTVLLISWFVLKRRAEFKEADMGTWVSWATAYSVGDPAGDVYSPNLVNADQFAAPVFEFARRAVNGEASAVGDNYAILNRYLRVITDEIEKLETELGRSGDVQQPLSALQASTIVLGVLDDLGADAGRFSIRELNARYVAGRSRTRVDAVTVDLEITFFGDNTEIATTNFSMFRDRLQETPGIVDVEERGSTTLDAGEIERGIAIDGLKITVDPSLVINSEES